MVKLLIGGSPCTHWSIAQNRNRETTAEGIGWELFKNYLIAKEKFNPDFFLYENNKSAAQAIKDQIAFELGAPLQHINSALVSAQNRQRFYVHNFGDVPQPEDRGILLRDILENTKILEDKGYIFTNSAQGTILQNVLNVMPKGIVEQICVAQRGRYTGECETVQQNFEPRLDGKTNTITTVTKDNLIAEPLECFTLDTDYFKGAVKGGLIGKIENNGKYKNGKQPSQQYRVYTSYGKSICVDQDQRKYYLVPFDGNDNEGQAFPIYRVQNGTIFINGVPYPAKLPDGYYIIRKLTVTECCRLQTLPDDYCRAVSPSQAYRGLGNGWTAEVIIHLLSHALANVPKSEKIIVLSMYDGIGTGRYCFEKMGYKNVTYFAYEIDKHPMQIATSNFNDIIQCGDAFSVRQSGWKLPTMEYTAQTIFRDTATMAAVSSPASA